jgi:hypothetical protein
MRNLFSPEQSDVTHQRGAEFESDRSLASQEDSSPEAAWETDLLARELAADFPLHSFNELRRAIHAAAAESPYQDPTHIVDRARDRLHAGLVG